MGQSSAHPPRRNRNIVHAVVQYNARLARIGMGYEATTTTAHVPSCRNIYTLLHCIRKQRVSLGVGGSICRRSRGVDLMHMRASISGRLHRGSKEHMHGLQSPEKKKTKCMDGGCLWMMGIVRTIDEEEPDAHVQMSLAHRIKSQLFVYTVNR